MYWRLFLGVFAIVLAAFQASAALTPVRHYRLGEIDAGAINGGAATVSIDSAGTNSLTFTNGPVYSTDVPAGQNSARSLRFHGTNYGLANLVNLTTNFIVEAWVKSTTYNGVHTMLYSGNGGANGWGLMQINNTYRALFGGVALFGDAPLVANEWMHLSLVVSDKHAMLFTNGVLNAVTNTLPNPPVGSLIVGAGSPIGQDTFPGWVDEVRVSTFPVPPRALTLLSTGNNHDALSWPSYYPWSQVQYATNLSITNWITLTNAVVVQGLEHRMTNALAGGIRFYRLCDGVPTPPRSVVKAMHDGVDYDVPYHPDSGTCVFEVSDGQPNCVIGPFSAQAPLIFDASASVDLSPCGQPKLSFQWECWKSDFYGGTPYFTAAITNYATSTLVLPPNALPDLEDTGGDANMGYWRMRLTIRHEPFNPDPALRQETVHWFRFHYLFSNHLP